jgi:hypothetical protein
MIHIVGRDLVQDVQAFDSVKDCLTDHFDFDVYLAAFLCKPMGIDLQDQVIYNMEYLRDDNPLFSFGYLDTLKSNIVVDFARSNVEYLKKHGVEAFYMPYGFDDSMRRVTPKEQDIDVLFIGSMHFDRRQKIISELSKVCNVQVALGVYGAELDDLIARSKVHLNMHHAEGQPLETVRINYLLANDCTVVSELGNDPELNDAYQDSLVFCDYDNLVESCLMAIDAKFDCQRLMDKLRHDSSGANQWIKGKLCQQ